MACLVAEYNKAQPFRQLKKVLELAAKDSMTTMPDTDKVVNAKKLLTFLQDQDIQPDNITVLQSGVIQLDWKPPSRMMPYYFTVQVLDFVIVAFCALRYQSIKHKVVISSQLEQLRWFIKRWRIVMYRDRKRKGQLLHGNSANCS